MIFKHNLISYSSVTNLGFSFVKVLRVHAVAVPLTLFFQHMIIFGGSSDTCKGLSVDLVITYSNIAGVKELRKFSGLYVYVVFVLIVFRAETIYLKSKRIIEVGILRICPLFPAIYFNTAPQKRLISCLHSELAITTWIQNFDCPVHPNVCLSSL